MVVGSGKMWEGWRGCVREEGVGGVEADGVRLFVLMCDPEFENIKICFLKKEEEFQLVNLLPFSKQ